MSSSSFCCRLSSTVDVDVVVVVVVVVVDAEKASVFEFRLCLFQLTRAAMTLFRSRLDLAIVFLFIEGETRTSQFIVGCCCPHCCRRCLDVVAAVVVVAVVIFAAVVVIVPELGVAAVVVVVVSRWCLGSNFKFFPRNFFVDIRSLRLFPELLFWFVSITCLVFVEKVVCLC